MTATDLRCDICNGESGGQYRGVASVPGVPLSIAWCSECLKRDCVPSFVFDHDYFMVDGKLDGLNDWAHARETWVDGKYIGFDEYVKRITPEQVAEFWRGYDESSRRSGREGDLE